MSLRARLLVAVVTLISVALIVAASAIYAEQRSFLYNRFDQRVVGAAAPVSFALGVRSRLPKRATGEDERARPAPAGSGAQSNPVGFLPNGTFGALVDRNGAVLRGPVVSPSFGDRRLPPPQLPAELSSPGNAPRLFTVGSARGSKLRYRVAAVGLESGAGTVLVALPLREVDQTLERLVLVEALVVTSVIIVLVGLGWIVIRVALRPLDEMGHAASAIAGGDLSRRVSPATPRTEVGRLGLSLNRMLVTIEEAFADRARSEERRRQFLADASHELRTPLASIRGYAELFRLGAADDPAALARAMERIESEAARMGVLVEDLLVLAQLDEVPEAHRTAVDVSDLAAQAVADARVMSREHPVSFEGEEGAVVLGDPAALRQVLTNLVANAVIHTPPRTLIEVLVRREWGEVVVEVRDHGPGLPAGAEQRVFERFWRGEGARGPGRGGSGLGLSIVKASVLSHHGTVRAESRRGEGARFTIRLPAVPDSSTAPAATPALAAPPAQSA